MAHVARQFARRASDAIASLASSSASRIASSYDEAMRANARYVVRDVDAARALPKQLLYTSLAKIPEIAASVARDARACQTLAANARAGELEVRTAFAWTAFACELYAWFCVGEIVGRGGKLTGY